MADRELARLAAGLTGGFEPWEVSLSDVCGSARRLLEVSAVSVMVVSASAARGLTAGSDDRVDTLELLSGLLGEGPAVDAVRAGEPVLVGDLAGARGRWPQLVPEALERGVSAMFVFPLRVGALSLGTLTLYRDVRGALSGSQRLLALRVADAIVETVLSAQAHESSSDRLAAPIARLVERGAVIDQAVGMLTAQLDCDLVEAAVRLRAYAYAHDESLNEVARAVVERTLQLER